MAICSVSPFQEHASAVPGNIGIVNSRVLIWENDPLHGRPHQQLTFPFTQKAKEQLRNEVPNVEFGVNSAYLKPEFVIHDMWLATKKPTGKREEPQNEADPGKEIFELDFVPPQSDQAKQRHPGGEIYNRNGAASDGAKADPTTGRDIFAHQVWLYVGNLFKQAVPIHPSEYELPTEEVKNYDNVIIKPSTRDDWFNKFTLAELQNAPKWETVEIVEGSNGKQVFWPSLVGSRSSFPVHWTLEKLTPVWQGQDFFVTVSFGDQEISGAIEETENDLVDTDTEQYKYLMYDLDHKPFPYDTSGGSYSQNWIPGISNEAFFVPPNPNPKSGEDPDAHIKAARKRYWWRYKSYILIEIGFADPNHNYFIELAANRSPRLLHIGEEWDNKKRIDGGQSVTPDDFQYIKKCRVLSEFNNVSVANIFNRKDFRVTVRNHIGRLVITFEGHEDTPWIITRLDNDPTRFDFTKLLIPMVVPAGKLRIHGGNISCSIGYSPLQYIPSATIRFPDRQADTFEAENKDLYMTFANIGNSEKNVTDVIKQRYFKDPKFRFRKIGYDLDAHSADEIIKNAVRTIPIYSIYSQQYKKMGKGWVLKSPPVPSNSLGVAPPPVLSSGFVGSEKLGRPHTVSIINDRTPGKPFVFGLEESSNASYPYKEHASQWDVGIVLGAGSVVMPRFTDPIAAGIVGEEKVFENYVTPIVTSWSMIVLSGAKPFKDKVEPFDISDLVTNINDSWSTEAFTTINHELQIKCYIPDSSLPNIVDGPGQIAPNIFALGKKLLSLHNKSFYVTVAYWWDKGVGERDAPGNILTRSTPPDKSDLLIQMTGVAYGANLEKSVNKLYMTFTVKDYSSILDKQFIFNSPFFDGVADVTAVYELSRMAGFDDNQERTTNLDRRPLGYLQEVITNPNISQCDSFLYNGEESIYRPYDLPGSYSDLANPAVRFQNGESYWSAITKIAQLAAKVVYFDRWGVLRFENSPAVEAAFNTGDTQKFRPKFNFVTTPFRVTSGGGPGETAENRFIFDANQHVSHLVWEAVRYSRSVEDCINQIVLFTASNDIILDDGSKTGGFIIEGYTFFEQIFDPSAEGFFGFRKPFYQSNGVFGGIDGVRIGIQHYAKMKYPPAQISFETYGVPGLKPLDIITLDDQLFYITELSHELDPTTNRWWLNVSAEWLKPFLSSVGFLEERGPTDSGAGNNQEEVEI